MKVKRVAIIGSGPMGGGLALLFATKGIEVVFVGPTEELLQQRMAQVAAQLGERLAKWEITESERKSILSQIQGTINIEDVQGVAFIIEAVTEDLEIKRILFRRLGALVGPQVVISTNTSTLSISELASVVEHPERVIGLHFLYPPAERKVVEVIMGLQTSQETLEQTKELVEQLGRTSVQVYESPGFITTRLIVPFINEAMHALMEGVASAKGIDDAIRLGYNFSVGPLELADNIGLDVVMQHMEALFREFGDLKYRPCPLLRKMVRAGQLGAKSGRGFFEYREGRRVES